MSKPPRLSSRLSVGSNESETENEESKQELSVRIKPEHLLEEKNDSPGAGSETPPHGLLTKEFRGEVQPKENLLSYEDADIQNFLEEHKAFRNHKWGTPSAKFFDFFAPKRGRFNEDQEIIDLLEIALKTPPGQPFFPTSKLPGAHSYDKSYLKELVQEHISRLRQDADDPDTSAAEDLERPLSHNWPLTKQNVNLLTAILFTAADSRKQQHLNKAVRGFAEAAPAQRETLAASGTKERFEKRYKNAFGVEPQIANSNPDIVKIPIITSKNNQMTITHKKAKEFMEPLNIFVNPQTQAQGVIKKALTPDLVGDDDAPLKELMKKANLPVVFNIEHGGKPYSVVAAAHPDYQNAPPPLAWLVRQEGQDGKLIPVADSRTKQACVDKFMGLLSTQLGTPVLCTSETKQHRVDPQSKHHMKL